MGKVQGYLAAATLFLIAGLSGGLWLVCGLAAFAALAVGSGIVAVMGMIATFRIRLVGRR